MTNPTPAPAPVPAPVPTPPPAPAPAPVPGPVPTPPAPTDDGKTFTQADVDRIISGRLARFADYDDLKARADAATAANQTDLERAVAAAKAETTTAVTAQVNKQLVSAEVRAVAANLGFRDPADALAQFGDLASVKVDDAGQVDAAAVETRLKELATTKAYLLKDGTVPVADPAAAGIGVGGGAPNANVTPGIGRLQAAYAATPTK